LIKQTEACTLPVRSSSVRMCNAEGVLTVLPTCLCNNQNNAVWSDSHCSRYMSSIKEPLGAVLLHTPCRPWPIDQSEWLLGLGTVGTSPNRTSHSSCLARRASTKARLPPFQDPLCIFPVLTHAVHSPSVSEINPVLKLIALSPLLRCPSTSQNGSH
jgi:hypothetical protein